MTYKLTKNKFLTDSEFDELYTQLRKDITNRDNLMLLTALHTGARAMELLNIKASDLEKEHSSVFIHGLKGSHDREIPLPHWLYKALVKYVEVNGIKKELFPISYPRLHQIWANYRPCKKKFHSTRHTYAIRFYRQTKDLLLVKQALGHVSVSNTMIYMSYVYNIDEHRKWVA